LYLAGQYSSVCDAAVYSMRSQTADCGGKTTFVISWWLL